MGIYQTTNILMGEKYLFHIWKNIFTTFLPEQIRIYKPNRGREDGGHVYEYFI